MAGINKNSGRYKLLRQLIADGITCIFGNPGTSEQSLLDALRDPEFKRLKYYLALHEGAAVAMADAYARATHRPEANPIHLPAVVQLHSYAGLANGLGMMKCAHRGYTPMIVVAGEAGLKYEAMDGQMAADLVSIVRPFVKSDHNGPCSWRAVDSHSLLRLMRRAIKTAATPPTGPVFLALPADVVDQVNDEQVVETSFVSTRCSPDPAAICNAAQILAGGQNPLIIVGDGIAASGAQAELTAVAELLGADVRGANSSEVNMSSTHPLYGSPFGHMFGGESRVVTAAADVVLICGTTLLPEVFPSVDSIFDPRAKTIHFDLNTTELAKNFPMTIAAAADPKIALSALARELQRIMTEPQHKSAHKRKNLLATRNNSRRLKLINEDDSVTADRPLRASQFFRELGRRLSRVHNQGGKISVFDEALTNGPELCRYVPQEKPGSYFQARAGMLGTGLPGTVGLKIARPDELVFGFSGDGGSISTIQSLATAARYGIGAKFVVCNNRSYRILKYNLRQYRQENNLPSYEPYPDSFDLTQPDLRFDLLAQGMGVDAIRIENSADIHPALDLALSDDKPFLIDLVLSGEL